MNQLSLSAWVLEITGNAPRHEDIYIRAVTHGSFGERDYQRLEFLGDRVLGLTIASHLYEQFPKEPEGKLSQRLNGLVSGKFCSKIAKTLGVSDHIRLGKQARDDGARQSTKVLGDVMESLIGAVYLDHGMDAARSFILKHWEPYVLKPDHDIRHPKSALQEWAASNNRKTPDYQLIEKSGPDHDLKFRVKVHINKIGEVEAVESSIQAAENICGSTISGKIHMTQNCGVVALIGAPNAGKSTLINALVGQKVAITSSKPQTTRTRLLGIAIENNTQLLLVDTPGIFEPRRRLDRAMVSAAWEGAEDADIIVFLVDARAGLGPKVTAIAERVKHRKEKTILVLNKVDIAAKDKMLNHVAKLHDLHPFDETFFVNAKTGDGLDELKTYLTAAMPEGPWHFPEDQVSDASERLLAAEITREQLYRQLHAELPYATAIAMEQYKEREDGSLEIHQQILVEKSSQRAIILGKGGHQIRDIGAQARAELSRILGKTVHLYLHVKVSENWDDDKSLYEDMGLDWVK